LGDTGSNLRHSDANLRTWSAAIATLLPHISSPNLPARLQSAIGTLVPFEHMMIFGYRARGRPLDFFNVSDTEHRKVVVQAYIAGGYLLDPFYHAYQAGVGDQFYSLDQIAPDQFHNSEYNLSHYHRTGILDEMVVFTPLDDGLTAATSLTRNRDQGPFTPSEIALLNAMLPVINAFVRHHWVGNDYPKPLINDARSVASLQDHIQNAFRQFGRSILTSRETEVMGYILRGYSSKAMGDLLDISEGTVKIHRKNAYQKLSISSQSELFSMFINTLSDPSLFAAEQP
jgi:DNA-binding CsgD family transcriptional regulator